ncbi:Serine/threonine-protein kinase Sgk1 [Nibea albiflora]|uniref:Serine/threonine-protein kinase Sgk1 n=1 Tax=Nibea albiflora TaxID=240163 RepID=A0ACB7F745_NIBAL|nr:Serine/threonine-protein kinase Sgk1 [Nibea albiflora]
MTVTQDRPLTYAKMRRLVSFFSDLLKGKKVGFSDFLNKFVSSQQFCQHLDPQKILQRQSKLRREKEERGTAVLLARHRQYGGYYAVKVLQKQMIVKRKETPNTLYFVLDYVNGGELFYHLQREGSFPEPRAAFYAAEMAMALGYLHSLDIVYRDLKPENILLDSEGHVMLTDFGLCKEGVALGGIMHTFCGTPEYLAPEVLQGQPYSPAVDWWGLGTVLFEMIYGLVSVAEIIEFLFNIFSIFTLRHPFVVSPSLHFIAVAKQRCLRTYFMLLFSWVAEHLKLPCSLLEGLLERDVTKRLGGSHDLVELQEHPFFASINWDDLLARKVRPPFIPKVTGPCDVSYIDPEFTQQPVPTSANETCQPGATCEAFPGFSFMNPAEYVTVS